MLIKCIALVNLQLELILWVNELHGYILFKYDANGLGVARRCQIYRQRHSYLVQTSDEEVFSATVADVHWHVVVHQVA